MSYPKITVGEICEYITSGGTPKTTVESFYNPPTIPWLKTKEVNYCRIFGTETGISPEGLSNSSAKLIPANSVIVAMYGQGDTAGRVAINKIPLATNQACCNLIIDSKKADYEFVYYSLSALYDKFVSLKNGGAQPNLNSGIIKSIEIPYPDIETQRRIANILSAYDNLIENNQKQIKLLEEAAQRLYKEWFVDLHFPGYEDTPVVDGMPEGWTRTTVEDMSCILRRGISPKYNDDATSIVINQKCIRTSIVDFSEARKQEKVFSEEMNLQDSDTVICSTGAGTLGRVGQVFGVYQNTTFDSHVTLVRAAPDVGKQFMYHFLKSKQSYLMGMGKGSTNQLELNRSIIQSLSLLIPTGDILNEFEKIAQSTHDKITALTTQAEKLKTSRDYLLPKLMCGEVEVRIF